MSEGIFVGYEIAAWSWDSNRSKPLKAFSTVEAANKWKAEKENREFVFIEIDWGNGGSL